MGTLIQFKPKMADKDQLDYMGQTPGKLTKVNSIPVTLTRVRDGVNGYDFLGEVEGRDLDRVKLLIEQGNKQWFILDEADGKDVDLSKLAGNVPDTDETRPVKAKSK